MRNTFLQPDQPLGLPAGSVRSIIALGTVGAFISGVIEQDVALLVLGFYFGSRNGAQ